MATLVVGPFHLARGLGLDPAAVGLAMAGGTLLLSLMPTGAGVPGYVGPIVVVTLGYALFQTADNAAVMAGAPADLRGVTSGMLNLSRNLGLITGASVTGAVFALAAGTAEIASAPPEDVAGGMRATFTLSTVLLVVALAAARRRSAQLPRDEPAGLPAGFSAADADAR